MNRSTLSGKYVQETYHQILYVIVPVYAYIYRVCRICSTHAVNAKFLPFMKITSHGPVHPWLPKVENAAQNIDANEALPSPRPFLQLPLDVFGCWQF